MNQLYDKDAVPKNIQMRDVESAFSSLNLRGDRKYFDCFGHYPTDVMDLNLSHFKGVATFEGKMIFSHTVLELISNPLGRGQYLSGDLPESSQGSISLNHPATEPHPCGMQVCGMYLAVGIQMSATAPGSDKSHILIYNVRDVVSKGPLSRPLATLDRPDIGINGVAMTQQIEDGEFFVAGVNGNKLTIYSLDNTLNLQSSFNYDNFPDSGAGLGLITQTNGKIYLIAVNGEDSGGRSTVALYRVDIKDKAITGITFVSRRSVPIPGVSDTVRIVKENLPLIIANHPLWGTALTVWAFESPNSSFRWGRGVAVTSPERFELYATDRNVIPLSQGLIPFNNTKKDFSVVIWGTQNFPKGIGEPVGVCADGDGRPYAFVVGTEGHLWQNYWENNQWNWYDAGTPSTTTVATVVSAGVGVCTTGDGRLYAFVIGSDGHLWQNYWTGSTWVWDDLGTPGNVVSNTVTAGIGASTTPDGRPYAWVADSDGHLWQNYWTGSTWVWDDLGTPGNVASNTVTAGVGVCHTGDGRLYAFVTGSDGHLWQNYWAGSTWVWYDMGAPLNSTTLTAAAGVGALSVDGRPYAWLTSSNGHLCQNYWENGAWNWIDLGA